MYLPYGKTHSKQLNRSEWLLLLSTPQAPLPIVYNARATLYTLTFVLTFN